MAPWIKSGSLMNVSACRGQSSSRLAMGIFPIAVGPYRLACCSRLEPDAHRTGCIFFEALSRSWAVRLRSAFFAVEHVAHGVAPRGIQLGVIAAQPGAGGVRFFRLAAGRTAVGKARLARLQFEFLSANGTDFDRERHNTSMIKRGLPFLQGGPKGIQAVRHTRCTRPGAMLVPPYKERRC